MRKHKIDYFFSLKRFIHTINALLYREIITRTSTLNLGIFGVFLSPLIQLLSFVIFFSFIRNSYENILIFLTLGITIFSLFSDISFRSSNAIDANTQLIRTYRPIKIIDIIITRTLIESFLNFLILTVLLILIYIYKREITIENFNLGISVFFLAIIFSLGVGLVTLIISTLFSFTKNFLPFITRPIYFLSGVFFSLNDIPEYLKPFLSWNPLIHFIELSRNAFMSNYKLDDRISLNYAFYSAFTALIIGLAAYFYSQKELQKKC